MSCPDFSESDKTRLLDYAKRTDLRHQELGMVLGGTPENPVLGETCIGEECKIDIPVGGWGTYHTHPRSGPLLGCQDSLSTIWRGHTHACFGGIEDKEPKIRCWALDPLGAPEAVRELRDFYDERKASGRKNGHWRKKQFELACHLRNQYFRQVCEIGKERKPGPKQTSLMRRKRRR